MSQMLYERQHVQVTLQVHTSKRRAVIIGAKWGEISKAGAIQLRSEDEARALYDALGAWLDKAEPADRQF